MSDPTTADEVMELAQTVIAAAYERRRTLDLYAAALDADVRRIVAERDAALAERDELRAAVEGVRANWFVPAEGSTVGRGYFPFAIREADYDNLMAALARTGGKEDR